MTPLLLGLTAGGLFAQSPVAGQDQKAAVIDVGQPGGSRCLASQLIGRKISNSQNQDLGQILEIVLDDRNEHVAYAVVTFGGFLGMGEKYFAMPWRLLEVGQRSNDDPPRVTLGLDQATLKAAPGFGHQQWPDMADPTWAKQVDDYYLTRGEPARAEGAAEPKGSGADGKSGADKSPSSKLFVHRRLGRLIGMPVLSRTRELMGEVEDLVIDTRFATFDGAVISFGGTLGIGESFVLLSGRAMHLDRRQGRFWVDCSRSEFEAMALVDGKLPALNNDDWQASSAQWTARVAAVGDASPVDDRPVDAAARQAVPGVDAYDLDKVESVTATIVTVGTVRDGESTGGCVRLRVRDAEGRERVVHAAPRGFASQDALDLRAGRVVVITGAPVRHGTQTVLVAGSLLFDGKTAVLRDAGGRAIWTR